MISRRASAALIAALLFTSVLTPVGVEAAAAERLQIWFIRHAESEINTMHAPPSAGDGALSHPLTLNGVGQARALAQSLATTPILGIYTSTQLRAVQTADAIAFHRGMTVSLAPEAVPIRLGVKEGENASAVYRELARRWTIEKDIDARHGDGEGESFADVQRRFLPFVRELMNRHALDAGVILIVAHGDTIGLTTPVLATNIPADFALRHPLPYTGIVKTELRDSRLFCTEWAGVPSSDFQRRE